MAVDVTKPGAAQPKDTYSKGENFSVENGHLLVHGFDGGLTNIAVYVPGQWVKAVVRDDS